MCAQEVSEQTQQKDLQQASDLLVSYLASLGVEYAFGIPGGAIEPLFDAFARSEREQGPRMVVARHETGAAFMAAGYSKNADKLGVCATTTGPGATNIITGVATAYNDNIPLLVITAQTSLNNFGKGAFQESSDTGTDLVGLFQFCTVYSTLVSHIEQFERKLTHAILMAFRERKPVHLSVPIDIFRQKLPQQAPCDLRQHIRTPEAVDISAIKELGDILASAKKSVFILGAEAAESCDLIEDCAFKVGAALVSTPEGKGLIHSHHPLFKGVIGFAGHPLAREQLCQADVDTVIAVGNSMSEWAIGCWQPETHRGQRLVHIHPRATELCHTPMASLQIHAAVRTVFESLLAELVSRGIQRKDRTRQVEVVNKYALPCYNRAAPELTEGWRQRRVLPQWLMTKLPQHLPPNTRYVADVGNSMAWAIHYLHPRAHGRQERQQASPKGLFQATIEYASMGWAIGVSIGAALANPGQTHVCITGDGSWLMSGQEITVALQQRLPIIFIVLNDAALGMVKHGQRLTGAEQTGFELPQVDFALLAKSLGVRGINIRCPDDWFELFENRDWMTKGPVLLDVLVDQEQVPPIQSRTSELQQRASK
ncbi:acetolactate synthase-1/2/3 large subunit [Alteromonadaceae bacterium Bs31]|nr:acetolactate synthase-1/2/3 large subunit [Alteromonadaceae bacterium Bs31]